MGKIVDTPPMDANLRYEQWDLGIDTYFDSRQKGWLCAIEQYNGSGVVNQAYWAFTMMCPTYRPRDEKKCYAYSCQYTLRELLIHPLRRIF